MNKIAAYAPLLEKIFLAGLLIGVVLTLLHVVPFSTAVTVVSLYGLGAAYYFSAFQRFEMPVDESQTMGFKELLGFVIVPKVLWISCAVSVIGIAIFATGAQPQGYKQLMVVGGVTIAIALVILVFLSTGGAGAMKPLLPALLRAIPLLVADFYVFMK